MIKDDLTKNNTPMIQQCFIIVFKDKYTHMPNNLY